MGAASGVDGFDPSNERIFGIDLANSESAEGAKEISLKLRSLSIEAFSLDFLEGAFDGEDCLVVVAAAPRLFLRFSAAAAFFFFFFELLEVSATTAGAAAISAVGCCCCCFCFCFCFFLVWRFVVPAGTDGASASSTSSAFGALTPFSPRLWIFPLSLPSSPLPLQAWGPSPKVLPSRHSSLTWSPSVQ